MTYSGGSVEGLKVQNALEAYWTQTNGMHSAATVVRTVEEAIRCASTIDDTNLGKGGGENVGAAVLITGSLHLVGSALEVLDTVA